MTRLKAALIHLFISASIGIVVGVLLFIVWYPKPFGHAAGADTLLLLLVGVDLALGPLLTFVVFRAGKRWLAFDLAIIAIVQTAALVYGLSVVVQTRPVFIVAVIDHFALVSANEIAPADLAQGKASEFRRLSWSGPQMAGALMPTETEERNRVVFEAAAGKDLQNLPRLFVPYESMAVGFVAKAKPLAALKRAYPKTAERVEAWATQKRLDTSKLVWTPIEARNADLVMILDRESGEPLQPFAHD